MADSGEAELGAAQLFGPATPASVVAATAGGFVMYVLLKARGLLLVPIYARILQPDQLGVASLAAALATLLAPVLHLGLPAGTLVELPHLATRAQMAAAYRTIVRVVSLSVALGMVSIALVLSRTRWSAIDEVRPYALAVAVLVGGTVMRDVAAVLPQLYRETRFLAALNLSIEYGGAVAGVALIAWGWGAGGLLWGAGAAAAAGAAVGLRHAWRLSRGETRWNLPFVRSALSVGIPLFGISLAQWLVQSADRVFLAQYHGAGAVGVYGLAYSIASGVLTISATVNLVFLPVAVSLRGDPQRLVRFVETSLRLTVAVLGLCVAGAFLVGPWLVRTLAGAAYAEGGFVLPLMVLSYAVFTLLQLLQWIPMTLTRRVRDVAGCYAAIAGLNLLLDFALIPRAGMRGAAAAAASAHVAGLVVMAALARARLDFRWAPVWPAASLAVGSACLAALLSLSPTASAPVIVVATGALVCGYAGAARVIGALRQDDLDLVRYALSRWRGAGGDSASQH
jgi:O-antigen/teichoic acid export membrane protein